MRRKDREITDFQEIIRIIDECQIVRLGLADGEYPYIVPVNFAYSILFGLSAGNHEIYRNVKIHSGEA